MKKTIHSRVNGRECLGFQRDHERREVGGLVVLLPVYGREPVLRRLLLLPYSSEGVLRRGVVVVLLVVVLVPGGRRQGVCFSRRQPGRPMMKGC